MGVKSAVVGQRVARLPFQVEDGGASPTLPLHFTTARTWEVNWVLKGNHYLGPLRRARYGFTGWANDELVAGMLFSVPSARYLPNDGTWLELARWVLLAEAGTNAGSRMFAWVRRWLQRKDPGLTTLVSYSDPSRGHTGALYKACGWVWKPTWHRLKPPPSGNGSWNGEAQSVKDRWVYELRPDDRRAEILAIK